MSLLEDWKIAKRAFEAATGKKKPSPKLSSKILSLSSGAGLDKCAKLMDDAIESANPRVLGAALNKFETAVEKYLKTLTSEIKDDGQNYSAELKKLRDALNSMAETARKSLDIPDEKDDEEDGEQDEWVKLVRKAAAKFNPLNANFSKIEDGVNNGLANLDENYKKLLEPSTPRSEKPKILEMMTKSASSLEKLKQMGARQISEMTGLVRECQSAIGKPAWSDKKLPHYRILNPMVLTRDALELRMDNLTRLVDECPGTLNEATAIVRNAGNANAAYLKLAQRMEDRYVEMTRIFDSSLRTQIGGLIDSANMNILNAGETDDHGEKQKLFADARKMLDDVLPKILGLVDDLKKAQEQGGKDLGSFPRGFLENEARNSFDAVMRAMDSFGEFQNAVSEEATKRDKLLKKIP